MMADARSRKATVLSAEDRMRLLSRLVDQFEARGWRDDGHTAWALVRVVAEVGGRVDLARIGGAVSPAFRAKNGATLAEVLSALDAAIA
jgi:hypothetical protein